MTSVKPFPQAEDETSHMKANTAVTIRSLKERKKKGLTNNKQTKFFKKKKEKKKAKFR